MEFVGALDVGAGVVVGFGVVDCVGSGAVGTGVVVEVVEFVGALVVGAGVVVGFGVGDCVGAGIVDRDVGG